jgi:uncharacterized protein YndB with AHSA1/START domain
MENNFVARADININASLEDVWNALVDPEAIHQYMFGATVVTDWRQGSPIVWRGTWEGRPFEDKGEILQLMPGEMLQYSHFSPLSGDADLPENYHTVTVDLSQRGEQTHVGLAQDGNASDEERQHAEENWGMMLSSLKNYLEN